MTTPSLERTFRGHRNGVSSGTFHPSLQQLATGSLDGNVMVWSSKPTVRAFRFVGHRGPVTDVDFNRQGSLIASASADATVRLWVPSVRGESSVIKAHNATVRSARFSCDGHQLITCSDDKSVKLWSVATQRFVTSYLGHQNWVSCCGLAHDGRVGVSGGDDKTVQVWDVNTRKNIFTFYEHIDSVTCVAFHPDGNCVAAGSADRTINLWDLRTNRLLQHYDAHGAAVTGIDFDATGSWLLSSSRDATAKLWDLKEGYHYCTVSAHEGPLLDARFSPCSRQFVTTGQDALVMVWSSNLPGSVPDSHPALGRGQSETPSLLLTKSKLRSPSAPKATTPASRASSRPQTAPTVVQRPATSFIEARPLTSQAASRTSHSPRNMYRDGSPRSRLLRSADEEHDNNNSIKKKKPVIEAMRPAQKTCPVRSGDTEPRGTTCTHETAHLASSDEAGGEETSSSKVRISQMTNVAERAVDDDHSHPIEGDVSAYPLQAVGVAPKEADVSKTAESAISALTAQMRLMEERNTAQESEIQKLHEALLIQQQIVQDLYARLGAAVPSHNE